ncbi:MAG: SDR family oxidoreductase [Armatimonadota bacterium]|nr:SDR family oxidoreductase [Armatimonadota bacterium]
MIKNEALLQIPTLQDKALVIIGGTTGLGLSAARAFAAAGAQVIVVGRNTESAQEAERKIGPSCRALVGDATDPHTAPAAIKAALIQFGAFHGLYHVAGGSGRKRGDGPLHEITDEGWDYTIHQNLSSVFYSNRAAAQQFLAQGTGGSVLNLGSILGLSPSREYFSTHAYAAAKAAIIGLSRSSAAYYAPHNIRFNVLAPSLVETPMARRAVEDEHIMEFIRTKQPLDGGRIGQPDDLDGAAVFFMSDGSRFVTGQVLSVDGGWAVSDGQYATGTHDAG